MQGPEMLTGLAGILMMGITGILLAGRTVRVLQGRESADGLPRRELPGVKEAAAVFAAALAVKLLLFAAAYLFYRLSGGTNGPIESLQPLWTHWDARHYLGIAQDGYTAVGDERYRLVFFPLYPLLMRGISRLTGMPLFYAGTVLSVLCGSTAAVLLYTLCRMHGTKEKAVLATAYFLLNPMSVFTCCVYTEGLFLVLMLAMIVLLRRGKAYASALCAGAAALTRMPGLIAVGLLLIAAADDAVRGKPKRRLLPRAAQIALAASGFLLYLLINKAVTGDAFMYMTYQRECWYQEPGMFYETAAQTMRYFLATVGEEDWLFTWGMQLVCMLYVMGLMLYAERKLPYDLAAYSFVYILVVLSPTWLLSGPRYLFGMATLPMMQASVEKKSLHVIALTISALLLIVHVYGYTIAAAVL